MMSNNDRWEVEKMYETVELIVTIAFIVVAGIAIYQAIKKKKK